SLIFREVFAFYRALARSESLRLPPAPPYRRYLEWLSGQDLLAAEAFWRAELEGLEGPVELPFDRPAGSAGAGEYRHHLMDLSVEETAALEALAHRHRLTLNTFVQGSTALLLARYGGARDVLFGAVVSGRPPELPEVESVVGLFINTLPVLVGLEKEARLETWLSALQETQLEARRFEFAPLAKIQRWSPLEAGQALFHCVVAFENYPVDEALLAAGDDRDGLRVQGVRGFERSNYPLNLVAALAAPAAGATPEGGHVLRLDLQHDGQRFDPVTVERLAEHLRMLLLAFSGAEGQSLDRLPSLPASQRRQLVEEWSGRESADPSQGDTSRASSYEVPLPELFRRQARRRPEAVALKGVEGGLTYAELDAASDAFADRLLSLELGPEPAVGLLAERSISTLVALLGIVKAGGFYVPLSPRDPAERLAFQVADAALSAVVAEKGAEGLLPGSFAGPVLPLGAVLASEPRARHAVPL
ncbi:MAG: AMP-binding protein, partial [Acidobacteria bacterium]|nr:AMP-binding protein [Acidobacteriota bacterium]